MNFIALDGVKTVQYPTFEFGESEGINRDMKFITEIARVLNREDRPIVFLARGFSMAMYSSAVAYILRASGKHAVIKIIRKPGDDCHDGETSPFIMYSENAYVVVDDYIYTGRSIKKLVEKIIPNGKKSKVDYLFLSNGDLEGATSFVEEHFENVCIPF